MIRKVPVESVSIATLYKNRLLQYNIKLAFSFSFFVLCDVLLQWAIWGLYSIRFILEKKNLNKKSRYGPFNLLSKILLMPYSNSILSTHNIANHSRPNPKVKLRSALAAVKKFKRSEIIYVMGIEAPVLHRPRVWTTPEKNQ